MDARGARCTFNPMRRASAWFGLVFLVWSLAGMGLVFFWQSTSAKRTLAERVAQGEALERWVLSPAEFEQLNIVDGEFWHRDRLYDVMSTEALANNWVVLQVFDDSHEAKLAKAGRKLFKRRVSDPSSPPVGLDQWASWHAVLPADRSMKIAHWACDPMWEVPRNEGKEARWSSTLPQPPNGSVAA